MRVPLEEFTGDVSELPGLLDQIDADIASLTADGAYDGEAVYDAVADRQPDAEVTIPPRATQTPLAGHSCTKALARPEERQFLGFSISNDGSERRIAPKALDTFKTRIREQTRRTRAMSPSQIIVELTHTLSDGAATSASAKPREHSRAWKRGSAEDYVHIFGGSGRTGTTASKNCADVA